VRDLSEAVERFRSCAEQGHRLLFGLDFDGTLTPFVEHPHFARMDERTSGALRALAREPQARVVVLSSRGLRDLAERIEGVGIDLVGSQGLELRIDGCEMKLPSFGPVDPSWSEAIEGALRVYPGAWLERKPAALAVHVRRLPARSRVDLERLLRDLPGDPARGAVESGWMRCRQTLEWVPVGAGKERGLRALLERWRITEQDLLLYAGDDENDAGAMREVRARGGIAIGVGEDAPREAEFHVPDSGVLAMFLRTAVGSLSGPRGGPATRAGTRTESRNE
jgi:trehalose 6-phosphate phosphatase